MVHPASTATPSGALSPHYVRTWAIFFYKFRVKTDISIIFFFLGQYALAEPKFKIGNPRAKGKKKKYTPALPLRETRESFVSVNLISNPPLENEEGGLVEDYEEKIV